MIVIRVPVLGGMVAHMATYTYENLQFKGVLKLHCHIHPHHWNHSELQVILHTLLKRATTQDVVPAACHNGLLWPAMKLGPH